MSSRTASAPTQQSGPTTEQPRTCAVGSTCALFATGSGHSRVLTYGGREWLFEIAGCTARYSLGDLMLNQFPSSSARPPIVPPWSIQSIRMGMNEIFLLAGMRAKISGFQMEMLA